MDASAFSDKNIIAGFVVIAGGLARILLGIDPEIPMWKQFILLVLCALPLGWLTYYGVYSKGYPFIAFPAGYLMGTISLSVLTIVAKDGARTLIDTLIATFKRGKQ